MLGEGLRGARAGWRRWPCAALLLVLAGCASSGVEVGEIGPPQGISCVPYARMVSGVEIYGDAWTWWDSAAGRYHRGRVPEPGAVLVMQSTPAMRSGHLSVVEEVVGPREVRVTQANWGNDSKSRGRVERGTPVIDVSPDNSWRAVRVWNRQTQAFGRVNPAYGFIYPRPVEVARADADQTAAGHCAPPQPTLPFASLAGEPTDGVGTGGTMEPSIEFPPP